MPLQSYVEQTPGNGDQLVRQWRPHFRPARHQHIVQIETDKPVWTLLVTGNKTNEWGFWDNNRFIHNEKWLSNQTTLGDSA